MNTSDHNFQLHIDRIERLLKFNYEPDTEQALFDICDISGRIVKTGSVQGPETSVRVTDLEGDDYYLMVLDGELSTIEPFHIRTK